MGKGIERTPTGPKEGALRSSPMRAGSTCAPTLVPTFLMAALNTYVLPGHDRKFQIMTLS